MNTLLPLEGILNDMQFDNYSDQNSSRELSLAITKVEEAIFWLKKAYRDKNYYVAPE